MELLAIDSEGVAGIIRNSQSNVEEADFSAPFGIDSLNLIIFHIELDKVLGTPFNNPQNTWVSECDMPRNKIRTPASNIV